MVVTLPHEVIALGLFNRKIVSNLLFESASRALIEFSLSYERLRAQVGFTAVLHTWDQDLNFHPHLHIVATGGGLSPDGSRWISATNGFLLPVRALSKIIRAKFAEALDKAFQEGRLKGNAPCLKGKVQFARFTSKLKKKEVGRLLQGDLPRLKESLRLPKPLYASGSHLKSSLAKP
jgi:hypothetical protein